MPKPASKKEWREAVNKHKQDMYMGIDCGFACPITAHKRILALLNENPRLRNSKYGKHYIDKTKDMEYLFAAHGNIEAAIENTLADALGAASLKYWGNK